MNLNVVQEISLSNTQNFESVASSAALGLAFAIVSDDSYSEEQAKVNRNLVSYRFNRSSLTNQQQTIPVSSLGLNDSESIDIMLIVAGPHLIVTDGVKITGVDPNNFFNNWAITLDLKNSTPYNY